MLVLKRFVGESIIMRTNGEILATITVVDDGTRNLRIGIKAAEDIEINREEVDLEKYRANRSERSQARV